MLRRRLALTAAVAGLALAAPASALADCAGADVTPDAGNLVAAGQTTLCLVNQERAANGLGAVSEDARLTAASTAFSNRMVAEQFFDHVAPDGSTLVQRLTTVGYIVDGADWSAGENIAWGQGDLSTPRSIVAAWMASPGHRANILDGDYTQMGLGLAAGSPVDPAWGATYTTDFGHVEAGAPTTVDRSAARAAAAHVRLLAAQASARKKAQAAAKKARARRSACLRARTASKHSAKHSVKGKHRAKARACAAHARSSAKR
jgi:uncharacterized protein YkwD